MTAFENALGFWPPLIHFHNIFSLLGHSQYILWSTDPDRGFFALSEEKYKNKNGLPNSVGQKFFFLVGDNFI